MDSKIIRTVSLPSDFLENYNFKKQQSPKSESELDCIRVALFLLNQIDSRISLLGNPKGEDIWKLLLNNKKKAHNIKRCGLNKKCK